MVTKFRSVYGSNVFDNVEIATVDGFQGREKDIIIFSCVRAPSAVSVSALPDVADREGEGEGIGFLKSFQRLNVAITRARYALWIVGHQQTLESGHEEWQVLLRVLQEQG
jgi:senataxin